MRRSHLLSPLIVAALLAGGCTTLTPPVDVTRFHRIAAANPLPRGSFRIVERPAADLAAPGAPSSLEWGTYAAAVSAELAALGYSPVVANAAQGSEVYLIDLTVERGTRAALRRSPVNVGVGGSTDSYGSGVGVGVGVNLGSLFGSGGGELVATRLAVRLARPGDAQPLWEGRAETEVGSRTPAAQPGLAARRLATALFAGFPGRSGETITVP